MAKREKRNWVSLGPVIQSGRTKMERERERAEAELAWRWLMYN